MNTCARFKIVCVAFCLAVLATTVEAKGVCILPIGDSITEQGDPGYRYALWKELTDADVSFGFVGSMRGAGNKGPSQWAEYKGHEFDSDHEGHSGWTSSDLLRGCDWELERGKLQDWLKGYTPDVVFLHIGTNDAFHLTPTDETIANIGEIIDQLRAANPAVTVFLAKIIPLCGQWEREYNPNVIAINGRIDGVAKEKSTRKSRVIVVDHYAGFDKQRDTDDEIHPNPQGQRKMAKRWADAFFAAARSNPAKFGLLRNAAPRMKCGRAITCNARYR